MAAKSPRERGERTRIVVLGWYGSNNTGDEALAQVVVEQLRERGLKDIVVLSTNPARTAERLRVESRSRKLLSPGTLRALRGAKALVLGGGGLIQDGTSVYNLPIYAVHVAVARLLGLRVIGWGLGAEPLWTRLGQVLARFIVHSSDHFSVRDGISKRLLAAAGVRPERVTVAADPAFLLRPEPVSPISSGGKPVIIFCVRHVPMISPGLNLPYLMPVSLRHKTGVEWREDPERVQGLIQAVGRAVKVAVEELGAKVVLLPLWPGRDDEMMGVIEEAAARHGVPPEAVVRAELGETPGEYAGYVGRAALLVSMRLHALIFAAGQGVPSLALSYARKVRGVMRGLGAERWVVEVEKRTPPPEEVEMKLRLLWQERDAERERLGVATERARAVASADANRIAGLLKGETG